MDQGLLHEIDGEFYYTRSPRWYKEMIYFKEVAKAFDLSFTVPFLSVTLVSKSSGKPLSLHYAGRVLDHHEDLYNGAVVHLNLQDMQNVFNEVNVINLGRALTYLTLVYHMNIPEEGSVRGAVRLVAPF